MATANAKQLPQWLINAGFENTEMVHKKLAALKDEEEATERKIRQLMVELDVNACEQRYVKQVLQMLNVAVMNGR